MKRPKSAAIAAAVTLILAALLMLSPYIANPATAQTALPAPSLNVVAGDSSIEISWTEIEGAAHYDLWAWWDEGTGWQRLANNLTDTKFSHTDVRAGVTYWYSVAAFNAGGERGPYSEYASAVAPAQPSPTPLPPTATQVPASPTPVTPGATVQPTQTPYPTYTPAPTYTPYPTPTLTPTTEWCRVAQTYTIQGGTLSKYRTLFPNAQAPSYPRIVEIWNSGNQTAVMFELDGFYQHSDGRSGEVWGIEYYSACTYTETRIWFVPFSWHGGDIVILLRNSRDHNDKH